MHASRYVRFDRFLPERWVNLLKAPPFRGEYIEGVDRDQSQTTAEAREHQRSDEQGQVGEAKFRGGVIGVKRSSVLSTLKGDSSQRTSAVNPARRKR
jgi:hypothetical protein